MPLDTFMLKCSAITVVSCCTRVGGGVDTFTERHGDTETTKEQKKATHCRQHGHLERLGLVRRRQVGESLDHEAQQQACKIQRMTFIFDALLLIILTAVTGCARRTRQPFWFSVSLCGSG